MIILIYLYLFCHASIQLLFFQQSNSSSVIYYLDAARPYDSSSSGCCLRSSLPNFASLQDDLSVSYSLTLTLLMEAAWRSCAAILRDVGSCCDFISYMNIGARNIIIPGLLSRVRLHLFHRIVRPLCLLSNCAFCSHQFVSVLP